MRRKSRASFILAIPLIVLLLLMALPASIAGAADVAKGKTLFDQNCASCHGEAGKGGVGPPLAKDVAFFVNAGVPAQLGGALLTQPLRQRPQGSKMPEFGPDKLSDSDIGDIGAYLFSLTPAPSTPPKLGTAANGAKPYADNCAACHGAKGEGGAGPPVATMAAQFKQFGLPENIMLGVVMLATRSGSLPTMPAFPPDKLSDAQLADVAAHIWSIAPAPSDQIKALAPTGRRQSNGSYYLALAAIGAAVVAGGIALRLRARRA